MRRAKAIELHSRKIEPIPHGKRKNVYINGADDNYPERIELLINNSVTAKMAVNKMMTFVVGQGFEDETVNNRIFNSKKDLTGYDLLVMIAKSVVKQKASVITCNYNGLFEANELDVLPYQNCRKEKGDDIGGRGKIFYSENWNNKGFSFSKKNEKSKWFYPFSRNKDVIATQFKADNIQLDENSKTHNFRGHAYFLNLEPELIYPMAFLDPAYNDAESEYHSSIHRNNTIKNGFTDKQVIIAKQGSEEHEEDVENLVTDMLGSDGSNIGLLEVDADTEDLTKVLHTVSFGSDVKAERYQYFDEINESKILHCFENIPRALVLGSGTSLIGDGGKKLQELKLNYSQDVAYIRRSITQSLTKIMPKVNWAIKPLVSKQELEVTNE